MPPSSLRSEPSPKEIQNSYNVLDSTTLDRLRTLLKDLRTTAPANFIYIEGELMLQPGALKRAWSENDGDDQDEGDEEDGEDDSDDTLDDTSDDTSEDAGLDRESDYSDEEAGISASRQRFEICGQCSEEYDAVLNDKKSCEWHDDDQEVGWDGDFWADHDEPCHGPIDTSKMSKTYPERFVWDCCGALGDVAVCKLSRHRSKRAKRVRR